MKFRTYVIVLNQDHQSIFPLSKQLSKRDGIIVAEPLKETSDMLLLMEAAGKKQLTTLMDDTLAWLVTARPNLRFLPVQTY